MENIQLWLLGEMSSASLSGAGGLDSASDFPPRTLPLLPPPIPPQGRRSRKGAKETSDANSLVLDQFGGGGRTLKEI